MASLLPPNEPPPPVEGAAGHFDHTNWVMQALKNLDAGTARPDGSVVFGDITINPPASEDAQLFLQGAARRSVVGQTSLGKTRWRLSLGDTAAEGGSDSGAKFGLYAYNDNGDYKYSALDGSRIDGLLTVRANPTVPLGIATKQYVDVALPVGSIIMWGGSTIPAEMQATWQLCNGTAHNSSELLSLLGSPNTPDLRSRFIVGVGQGTGLSNYPVGIGADLGDETIKLTAAQSGLPAHAHTATSGSSGSHSHAIDTTTVLGPSNGVNNDGATGVGRSYHLTTPNTDPAGTHSHTVSVATNSAASAASAHENRPPYYAMTFIIKKG